MIRANKLTQLEGPRNVGEFGENSEFGENGDFGEISPIIIIIIIIYLLVTRKYQYTFSPARNNSRSNWNLEMLVFEDREKPEDPEKNLSEQRREPTTNSTHI